MPNVASNVVDKDEATRWANEGRGSWIQADLGEKKTIKDVGIVWYKADQREYNFEISVSNTTQLSDFIRLFNGKSNAESIDVEDILGRYVRITINGNTDGKASSTEWASIIELWLNTKPEVNS